MPRPEPETMATLPSSFLIDSIRPLAFRIQRHHASAANAQIVLQRPARSCNLPRSAIAAQLLYQLRALRQASRPERMAFREQPARRIDHVLPAIGVIALLDHLFARPL